ncbi:unnamed protein product [Soboliphyme baturini]|uniref:EamA domain-containing protein n=1 Tax=Soboliphyme baturini TaxID=241478 RepID=A0A183IWJ4_9BILA|nr:unnamed protein product [Soboliphyme baturini]
MHVGGALGIVTAAFLWGISNVLLKLWSSRDKAVTWPKGSLLSFSGIGAKTLVAFIVNQCGSVVYFISLKCLPLTIAAPVTNALTLVITVCADHCLVLHRKRHNWKTWIGCLFVAAGIMLCLLDSR